MSELANILVFINERSCFFFLTRLLRNFALHQENQDERPTVKKLFDVSERRRSNLSMAKVHEFSDTVLCLEKVRQFPESNEEWKAKLNWFKTSSNTENCIESMESRWNSSG